jgi:hypothetical protein
MCCSSSIGVSIWRLFLVGVASIFLLAGGGCAILPLATLGTVSGIAGTAISTGPEVTSAGKVQTAFRAQVEDCRQAVRLAGKDLGLRLVRDRPISDERVRWEFELLDERDSEVDVTVERRSPMLCWCEVDVGIFGSQPTAKLMLQVIISHLPKGATENIRAGA